MRVKRQFDVDLQEWNDFLYIIKVKTKQQGGSEQIRKFIANFNKRNKHILDKRL